MLDQALFTSVRGNRLDGYQLAVTSGQLSEDETRELARWGPAHDALLDPTESGESLNFHRLESGRFCLSQTVTAGAEYSERGGLRVATWLLLAAEPVLARFSFNPFRLADAAIAAGWLREPSELPTALAPLSLSGRASPIESQYLAQISAELGARPLALLLEALLSGSSLVIAGATPKRLLRAAMSLVPLARRAEISFTTGLRYSPSRPFRVQPVPTDDGERRQLLRGQNVKLFEIAGASNTAPSHEWAQVVERALEEKRLHKLAGQMARPCPRPISA